MFVLRKFSEEVDPSKFSEEVSLSKKDNLGTSCTKELHISGFKIRNCSEKLAPRS